MSTKMRPPLVGALVVVGVATVAWFEAQASEAHSNLTRSANWLLRNSARPGVHTTQTGLQYRVIESAPSGSVVGASAYVCVHARGALVDGTVFWSQLPPAAAISFNTRRVIAGWKEALSLMRVGATWEIYVPPYLGYGAKGYENSIGPYEALVFQITVHRIQAAPFAKGIDCRETVARNTW